MRLLLGLAEGGLFPGYAFYLSSFYPRYEVVTRISIVGSSAYTSGFIGPFLALGFEHLPDFGPIHTWRHIYLFEGIISMVLGTVSFIILPTDIETAWFLKPAEKQVGLERLRRQMLEETVPGVRMKDIKAATMNIGNWIASILYMAINVPTQACIIFLPSVRLSSQSPHFLYPSVRKAELHPDNQSYGVPCGYRADYEWRSVPPGRHRGHLPGVAIRQDQAPWTRHAVLCTFHGALLHAPPDLYPLRSGSPQDIWFAIHGLVSRRRFRLHGGSSNSSGE